MVFPGPSGAPALVGLASHCLYNYKTAPASAVERCDARACYFTRVAAHLGLLQRWLQGGVRCAASVCLDCLAWAQGAAGCLAGPRGMHAGLREHLLLCLSCAQLPGLDALAGGGP